MLQLTEVTVHYGRIAAVNKLSLEVKQGELVGVVGHNGGGKSTTPVDDHGRAEAEAPARSSSRGRSAESRPRRSSAAASPSSRRTGGSSAGSRSARTSRSARRPGRTGVPPPWTSSECASASRCWGATTTVRARSSRAASSSARDRRALLAPQAPPARRADPRAGAAHRRPGLRDPPGAEGGRFHDPARRAERRRTIEVADRTYVLRSGGRVAFHGTSGGAGPGRRLRDGLHRHGGDVGGGDDRGNPVPHRRDRLRQPLRPHGARAGPALQRDGPHELRLRRADHGRCLHDVLRGLRLASDGPDRRSSSSSSSRCSWSSSRSGLYGTPLR